MALIDRLFEEMMAKGGSDLHLAEGAAPKDSPPWPARRRLDDPVHPETMRGYLQGNLPAERWNVSSKPATSRFRVPPWDRRALPIKLLSNHTAWRRCFGPFPPRSRPSMS